MKKCWITVALMISLCPLMLLQAQAGENELTEEEKAAGWQLIFNGKDHTGWKCNNGKPVATPVEDGSLVPYKSGGYLVIYEKPLSDFILKCEVKMGEQCNSGIFFRVGDLKNPVQSGFETQVITGKGTTRHDFGSIYDLVPPSKNLSKGPGKWNTMTVKCQGPLVEISVNGEKVASLNCDEWTEPGKRLDGSKHKFKNAVKDFPRKGYVGFQDHGHKVWFRNIKLLELTKETKSE